MFKEIMNETNAMSLSRDVIFLGIRQDVHRILSAFDVFVFPSKYEGFGIALLEAQAAGLPCVVSDAIVKEAIITEVSVLPLTAPVTQWADKILEYRGYPRKDQSHIISEHGYDIEDTVRKLTDFYSTQQGKDE
ncbi:hypothetical protein AGMMS49992_16360 [Clostridia bacterium]|nr:hypothetical protein AGMMS49992_16360 [Clostridia bacterium]